MTLLDENQSLRLSARAEEETLRSIRPVGLGSARFGASYGIKYAYLAGAMYKGIASKEMASALAKSGLVGYLGTGGLGLDRIESGIRYIQREHPVDARSA